MTLHLRSGKRTACGKVLRPKRVPWRRRRVVDELEQVSCPGCRIAAALEAERALMPPKREPVGAVQITMAPALHRFGQSVDEVNAWMTEMGRAMRKAGLR